TPPPTSDSWSISAERRARTPSAPKPGRANSGKKSSANSSRTSKSGGTSATRTRRRWQPPNTRGSPQFASGPSSFIPTASVAAPPKRTPHHRKAEPNECTAPRVPSGHRQRRFGDDQADRAAPGSGTHWGALLLAGQGRQGQRRTGRR